MLSLMPAMLAAILGQPDYVKPPGGRSEEPLPDPRFGDLVVDFADSEVLRLWSSSRLSAAQLYGPARSHRQRRVDYWTRFGDAGTLAPVLRPKCGTCGGDVDDGDLNRRETGDFDLFASRG